MFPAIAAATSAIDALKALTSTKPTTGVNKESANLFAFSADASASPGSSSGSGAGKSSQISPETMSALLAAQGQSGSNASAPTSRSDALKDLFAQIDVDGDGKLSKSEFEKALGAGGTNTAKAEDVFNKLDKDGDGSVSLGELMSALKGGKGHRHRAASGSGESGESDPLLQALQGASSTSVTNSDGTVTTSLTYADGSKVTMTSAASAGTSGAATSSYNFVEKLIQRQASMISAQASSSLYVSV
jgi:hypothetical protein